MSPMLTNTPERIMAKRISLGPSLAAQAKANERNLRRWRKAKAKTNIPERKMDDSVTLTISEIELLALKKLALVNRALADCFSDGIAKQEQMALTRVLVEVIQRASVLAAQP